MVYKLYYFNGMGRAEVARLLFAIGGVSFEDIRVTGDKWKEEYKAKSPFGSLPVLDVDGEQICQSKAIEFYVANKVGRAGKNDKDKAKCIEIASCIEDMMQPLSATFGMEGEQKKQARISFCKDKLPEKLAKFEKMLENSKSGLFIGDQITWADLALFQSLTGMLILDDITVDLSKFPKVKKLVDKVKADKAIAAAVAKRPKTTF